MKFFSPDYTQFFKDLAANNNRDWFQDNKKRYEQEVKMPFESFIEALALQLKKDIPEIETDPKKMCFRIYRDIRFSKDKTPYKLHMSAVLNKGGRKNRTTPGMYLQFGAEDLRYYTGVYQIDKAPLLQLRNYIARHATELDRIVQHPDFKQHFEQVRGEKNKVLPKDLKEAASKQELIFNKNFYVFKSLPAEDVTKGNLLDEMLALHQYSKDFRTYFSKGLQA